MTQKNPTRQDLAARYNELTGKSVKATSYTVTRFLELIAEAEANKPAVEFEPGTNENTPYPEPAGAEPKEEEADPSACPLCGGDPSSQTAAGAEGTFLGDSCNFCHDCGRVYNVFTGDEIPEAAPKTGKRLRRVLNPQPKIDAKVEACAQAGIELYYHKPARLWIGVDNLDGKQLTAMTSRVFSQYTPEELVEYASSFRK